MSVTYATLQTRIAGYLKRDDIGTDIPSLITLGENELNRRLELVQQEQITSFTLTSGTSSKTFSDIATTVASVLKVWKTVNGAVQELDYRNAEQWLGVLRISTDPDQPCYWTVQGGAILQFDRTADQDYTLYARVRNKFNIATDAATNYLALNHEDAYIFASLVQAEPFLKNDKRVGTWRGMLEIVLSQLEEADTKVRASRETQLIPDAYGYVGLRRPFNINTG